MRIRPWKPVDISKISPERRKIAKIFKTHIERAIDDLCPGYAVISIYCCLVLSVCMTDRLGDRLTDTDRVTVRQTRHVHACARTQERERKIKF